jgi:hypothetical protein|tara:strand:- start:1551 stop:1802 length:252 start_codon:yes stop_codon:yes gene_type:complete
VGIPSIFNIIKEKTMRVYHLWTTIELEDTDDDYFEEIDVPVSIGHFRTFDEATKYQIKLRDEWDHSPQEWYTDLIHDGEKSDD